MPRITEMLKDDDPRVINTAVAVFSNLAKKGEASDSLPPTMFFGETEVIRSRISRLNRCFYAPDHRVIEGRCMESTRG